MNKWQKLVQQEFLNNEEKVIRRLEVVYSRAAKDINDKIKNLELNIDGLQLKYDWMDDADPNKEKVKSMIQSKIYQSKYQEALQDQVEGILKKLQTETYLTVSDYLDGCYNDAFIGSLFDLHGQDIPLMIPLDQTKMVRAVQLNSKISQGLYNRLGEDVDLLKKKITAQVSRSVANGTSYGETARQLAMQSRIGYNNAIRIARTEGHRIQTTAAMDVMEQAKEKGADVVKQWDAALDGRTRASHRAVDGEIREVEEKFSNGLMYPGDPAGSAKEVINCRCALLQRARWALDEQELEYLKERANFWGLDKSETFKDFKQKYLKTLENTPKSGKITVGEQLSELGEFKKKIRSDDRMSEDYYQAVKDKFSHGSENAKKAFNRYVPTDSVIDSEYHGVPCYNPKTGKISMNYAMDLTNARGAGATWFHEHGHLIDSGAGIVSDHSDFRKLLYDDCLEYRKAYGKKHGLKTFDKVDKAISNELRSMREHSAVSDLLDAITNGNICGVASHSRGYWTDDKKICAEAFAHMYEAQFDEIRYAEMKKYFPTALKKFEEMLGGVV